VFVETTKVGCKYGQEGSSDDVRTKSSERVNGLNNKAGNWRLE
jgi:hypothetical protein